MGDEFIRSQNDSKFDSFLPNDLFISEEYLSPFNNGLINETYINDEVYNYFSFFIKKREDIKFYFSLFYYNKGIALKVQKNFEKAIEDFNIVIKLDPNHILAFANRGKCFLKLKKNIDALIDLDKIKVLLKTNKIDGLTEENIMFIEGCVEFLIKLENTYDELGQEIENKKEFENDSRFIDIIKEYKILNNKKVEQLRNLNLEGEVNLNKYALENEKLLNMIYELKDQLKNLGKKLEDIEKDIKLKLNDYEKLLEKCTKDEPMDSINKAKDYFFGFSNIFSNIYISSSVIKSGNINLYATNIPTSILSFLVSLIPIVGSLSSKAVKS